MQSDFTAQLARENASRKRRGLAPYADITSYLIGQGYSEAEARARASQAGQLAAAPGAAAPANEDPLDAASIYAGANTPYREAVYGADASAEDAGEHTVDPGQAGRQAGIDSPAAFLAQQDVARKASAGNARDYGQLAGDVYLGEINASYRKATAGQLAPTQ